MASKRINVGLYVLLAMMGVANLLLLNQNLRMRRSIEAARPARLAVGDRVPRFTAAGLDGEQIDVAYIQTVRDAPDSAHRQRRDGEKSLGRQMGQ